MELTERALCYEKFSGFCLEDRNSEASFVSVQECMETLFLSLVGVDIFK